MMPFQRLLLAGLWLNLPSAAALLGLTAVGVIAPTDALFAWLGTLALGGLLILPLAHWIGRLIAYAGGEAGNFPPPPWPGLGRELGRAVRDLDRRRLSESARVAAEAAFESMLQSVPDPLLLLDSDLAVSFANAAAMAALGGEPLGRPLAVVLRAPALLAAAQAVLADGAAREVGLDYAHDGQRYFQARLRRLEPSDGERGALALLLHDVTEMRRTERLRADFVANASHEIRTPLATLIGAVETLQGPARDDSEARTRFLEMMRDHAHRIERLVDDLLSLSRIERTERDAPAKRVALGEVLEHARAALDWKAKARDVRVVIPEPVADAAAIGDADELAHLFQNLIDNAIKYGSAHTEVRIESRRLAPGEAVGEWRAGANGALAVAVVDQGPGIPAEHLPRLTERFYRVDKARSRQLGGTGLGLAIVKHITARHRGLLRIESRIGEGSRFTVFLPAAAPEGPD